MTPLKLSHAKPVVLWIVSLSTVLLGTDGSIEVSADDWPQWQGPNRNAMSRETGLLQEWPEGGPAIAWRVEDLGGGDSAPSIADGRIFGMSIRGEDEVVWALSEEDGSELWVTRLGPAYEQRMPQSKEGPGCTPTVDKDRIYVEGMGGSIACLRADSGEIVWQRSLTDDFGGVIPTWSYRESPLVDGDRLIVTPGGSKATIAALDKMNGETIWSSKLAANEDEASEQEDSSDRGQGRGQGRGRGRGRGRGGFNRGPASDAAYASAIAIDFEGERQYVQLTGTSLVGIAADDGQVLWTYDRPANPMRINCSTPVFHDGLIFAASAYGNGGGAVKLSKKEDGKIQADEVYFTPQMQNHHGGMIVYEGALYGANGGNGGGFLCCLDFETGDVLWRDRDAPKGSIVFADSRIYLRSEEGELVLIEPNREKFVERGRFEQPDRSKAPAWAHPVIANGKLYIRDQGLLLCYDISK